MKTEIEFSEDKVETTIKALTGNMTLVSLTLWDSTGKELHKNWKIVIEQKKAEQVFILLEPLLPSIIKVEDLESPISINSLRILLTVA